MLYALRQSEQWVAMALQVLAVAKRTSSVPGLDFCFFPGLGALSGGYCTIPTYDSDRGREVVPCSQQPDDTSVYMVKHATMQERSDEKLRTPIRPCQEEISVLKFTRLCAGKSLLRYKTSSFSMPVLRSC